MIRWFKYCVCASIILNSQLSILNSAHAQWWEGWSAQTGLVLNLHLTDTSATLYSPLQSSEPIPASQWAVIDDTLHIKCFSIGLSADLARQDSLWTGHWQQGALREEIVFRPAQGLFSMSRPQTPQEPYHFEDETVAVDYIDSKGNAVHLEGTLTYPAYDARLARAGASDRYPCLVMVSGSGLQNRDEEIFQHKPFLVLADYLASRGIAMLRYDDRGVGASTGTLDSADTRLYAEDAEAMFNALKSNLHVDPSRLGIGGHSEGGTIASMVAARNKNVKFVVMLAGQGASGIEVLAQQNEALFQARGVSPRLCRLRGDCMRDLLMLPPDTKSKDYLPILEQYTEKLTPAEADSIQLGKKMIGPLKQQLSNPWMRCFLTLDPKDYLPKVTCPLLAINGTKDCQVIYSHNLRGILMHTSGRATCLEMEGLNHLFQHCTTGSPDEYIFIEETFAPKAMKAVAEWILAL